MVVFMKKGRNVMKTTNKQLIIYLIAAFGLAWPIQVFASNLANQGNVGMFRYILTGSMYAPLLAALIARIPFKGMGWVPHLKGKIRFLFFALWMPAVIGVLSGLLYFLIFPDQFDSKFETMRLTLGEVGMAQLEAQGMTVESYVIVSTISAVTMGAFFNMFFALGEEVGWRGALYPMLKERFGRTRGRILGGICWGAWHWPVMLLAGYEYGTDYIGAPILGLFVFCLSTIFLGILHDYVYEKTGTIWMPALLHGAVNAFTIFAYLLKPEFMDRQIFGPTWIGLIGMIPMAALAIILCVVDSKKKTVVS